MTKLWFSIISEQSQWIISSEDYIGETLSEEVHIELCCFLFIQECLLQWKKGKAYVTWILFFIFFLLQDNMTTWVWEEWKNDKWNNKNIWDRQVHFTFLRIKDWLYNAGNYIWGKENGAYLKSTWNFCIFFLCFLLKCSMKCYLLLWKHAELSVEPYIRLLTAVFSKSKRRTETRMDGIKATRCEQDSLQIKLLLIYFKGNPMRLYPEVNENTSSIYITVSCNHFYTCFNPLGKSFQIHSHLILFQQLSGKFRKEKAWNLQT